MAARDSTPASCAVDAHLTDPPLLRQHSHFKSYTTSRFHYPNLRVFFRQHAKAKELPSPLPLLVCIPGLGGSVAQFHPLLSSFVHLAPCLAIDHPGGGRSDYAVTAWDAYSPEALVELLVAVIEDHRDADAGQSLVLIGHSMGTALAAALASRTSPYKTSVADHVVGVVAICPTSGPWTESTAAFLRRLLWIPGWIFSLWRAWDARGGLESASVARFVGPDAEPELKVLQYRFNKQSRTPVWRRMAYGALPTFIDHKPHGGIPGIKVWAGLQVPLFLIAGEKDHVTSPGEVDKIEEALRAARSESGEEVEHVESDEAAPLMGSSLQMNQSDVPQTDGIGASTVNNGTASDDDAHEDPSTPVEATGGLSMALPPQPRHPRPVIRSMIMAAPANHTLLYMPRSVRALAGFISDFLATSITQRLSLAWQLQYLSREGKWDVKNLNKWKSVPPVSDAIGPPNQPVFRAMKTLREADQVHCPTAFVEKWGHVITDVVDISKDQPVYDPRGLERGGRIHYHKFPTVSKVPPEPHEVEAFIKLVDGLRDVNRRRKLTVDDVEGEQVRTPVVVGVHCHYGFNRTGYFIVCYLVERCGFSVPSAIEAFAKARPNGIRHSHFLDRLYVRYNDQS
ncbi:hypothetical protein CDD80_996 [Ophiocordyceps camponoti-rufipedis]|uniref:Tyrosine specific protein phosphatases domain-containing protein n=1 Tax=Ophiocordyceps camponoti-rufipedis TaxID=2004952 RepID=A0A2C5ZC74_9HYPO|nr:hypothetical protein CDD80_996 [Ophiocordyceps camponoti-rufipedis]